MGIRAGAVESSAGRTDCVEVGQDLPLSLPCLADAARANTGLKKAFEFGALVAACARDRSPRPHNALLLGWDGHTPNIGKELLDYAAAGDRDSPEKEASPCVRLSGDQQSRTMFRSVERAALDSNRERRVAQSFVYIRTGS